MPRRDLARFWDRGRVPGSLMSVVYHLEIIGLVIEDTVIAIKILYSLWFSFSEIMCKAGSTDINLETFKLITRERNLKKEQGTRNCYLSNG